MFKTVKSKFITLSIILIIFCIGTPVVFLINQFSKNFHEQSLLMLEATLDMLYYGLESEMQYGAKKDVQKIVEEMSSVQNIQHVRLFNRDGIISYASTKSEVGKNMEEVSQGHIKGDIKNILSRVIDFENDKGVYESVEPIYNQKSCESCHKDRKIISYLDVDTDLTRAEINFYTGSTHLIFLGSLLLIVLIITFYVLFNKLINVPLGNFILAMDEVERGKLDIRLNENRRDEFGIVNNHFNRMISELSLSKRKIDEMHFEQLQRADKMITLGELTSTMAHDINNYAAIIMARADYLQMESDNISGLQNYEEDFKVINDQINKISKITGNILKHSKKLPKNFTEFNLVELVNEIIVTLDPLTKKRNILLECKNDYSELKIFGDKDQIEQAIMNIINNALDVTKNNGILKLVISKNKNKIPQIVIKDFGTGIPKENLDKIYSPFFTTKSNEKGTGLGLYIAKKILINHNADIVCESTSNVGTTFTITFSEGLIRS